MNQLRVAGVALCTAICILGLVVSVVYTYTSRVLFDASMFSQRVADSLAQPDVARVVADQVTDQVLELDRDLTPYRPVLLGTVEYIVTSAPFRAVVQRAAKKSHSTLITGSENLTLTVSDLGVIVRNALAMYPQIAEKIPSQAMVVLGSTEKWPTGKYLLQVMSVGHRLRSRAPLWLGAGLVMGTCGLFLARRKDRYLLRLGLGLTITAFIVGVAARYGGEVLAAFTESPVLAQLVRGLWPVFLGPLAMRMLILAALGLVVVAAVTSLLEKVDVSAISRILWDHAGKKKHHAAYGLGRGLVFAAAGILAALHPERAMEVIAVIAGGVLFFLGIQEFFTTAVRFAPRTESIVGVVIGRKRSVAPAVVLVGGIVVLVVAVGVGVLLSRRVDTAAAPIAIDACNGAPELCTKRLDEVAFAATHNSMSAADISDWMFPNQEKGIRGQLEDGIRGFLVDIHYGVPVKGRIKTLIENEEVSRKKYEATLGVEGVEAAMRIHNRLVGEDEGDRAVYLGHGFCELGATLFVEALESMREFLVANPHEIVILIIQDEGVTPADVAACFAKSGLEDLVYRGGVTPPWPTLREMIERDERVVVFAENQAEGVPWYHPVFDAFQETPYGFKDPSEFSNAPNRGGTSGSLLLLNHWIETTPTPLPSNAEIVNAYDFLLKRARACKRARGMMPNLIAVDFYRTGDVVRVVRTLNGIAEPALAAAK